MESTQRIIMVSCSTWDAVHNTSVYLGTVTTHYANEAVEAQDELENAFPRAVTKRELVWIQ